MNRALARLLLAAAAARAYELADCGVEFAKLGYSTLDFDRYDVFFRDSSTANLALAGTYKGADGIKEYIQFSSVVSPYMDTYVDLDVAFGLDPARFDATTGSCVFTTARHQIFRTSAPAFPGAEVEFVSYGTVTFELDGAYISNIEVYIPAAYSEFYFNSLANTNAMRRYVCETMRDACPATWAANGYDEAGLAACVGALEGLPVHEPAPWFDGDSQSCRSVHAFMATGNAKHCPHISVAPMADGDGALKCYASARADVTMGPQSAFTDFDRKFYGDYKLARNMTADYVLRPISCAPGACPVGFACEDGICTAEHAPSAQPTSESDAAAPLARATAGLAAAALATLI